MIAKKQMRGFGSVITFLIKGEDKETRKFIDSLELFLITPSLGGSESLVSQMSMMSFFDYPEEYRATSGWWTTSCVSPSGWRTRTT